MDIDLKGVIPPLVTPIDDSGEIDRAGMQRLIEFQLDAGVDGVFLGGSTGEVALLDSRRQDEALDIAVATVAGAVPVLAGAIDTGTARVVERADRAVACGADAVVITAPFYVEPNGAEIVAHFRAVHAAVDAPLVAYDIPGATGVRLTPDIVRDLAESETVAALKDSSGDLVTFRDIVRGIPDFPVLTGSELLADVSMDLGANGLVPGLGNIDPHGYIRLYYAAWNGDQAAARAEQERLIDLFGIISVADRRRVGFTAGALGGFKAALALRGIIANPATNPPLSALSDDETARIAAILADAGLGRWLPPTGTDPYNVQAFYSRGMRWQRLQLTDGPDAPPALFGADAVAETVDTPEFAGLTFYVIHAKTIINKVPAETQVPFRYTVNPYRGCSHACNYCLVGDTPILMATGRTKPLAEIRVGDKIFGTVREGRHRRYVTTEVQDHWQTVKPAYRVELEDGTEVIASADHRFLSESGWKYVAGGQPSIGKRPHLTVRTKLLGTGQFALPPKDSCDYRQGYLCGIIRGNGHSGHHAQHPHPGRTLPHQRHRFRLVINDEAIARTRTYLNQFGVDTIDFTFQRRASASTAVRGLRASSRSAAAKVRKLVDWPHAPSEAWSKGFLAGTVDAQDHCENERGDIRICHGDETVVSHIQSALARQGFAYVVEPPKFWCNKPVHDIRVCGGLRERLRFLHTVDPAVSRTSSIQNVALASSDPLRVRSIAPLGVEVPMYDITTGTGDFIANGVVSHNCFARKTHEYLNLDSGADFDSKVVVKANAGRLLRKELAKPSWQGEAIAMGTNVDCYQRAEGRYRLMPEIIAALRDAANPFSILTKGTLILRDLELLRQAASVTEVSTAVSVGMSNLPLWRSIEPGTPRPAARFSVCEKLNAAGLECSVLLAPILPFLTDTPQQLRRLVKSAADAGATAVTPIVLHLRPGARESFLDWLWREHPELVADYQLLYSGGSYADKQYQRHIWELVTELAAEYGIPQRFHRPKPPPRREPEPEIGHPTLF